MGGYLIADIAGLLISVGGGVLGGFLAVYGIDTLIPGHPIRSWLDRPMWSRPEPPKYQVRLFDDKGIPIRTHALSGRRMAELIQHIDDGWYT
jgi:hypothetical protein